MTDAQRQTILQETYALICRTVGVKASTIEIAREAHAFACFFVADTGNWLQIAGFNAGFAAAQLRTLNGSVE